MVDVTKVRSHLEARLAELNDRIVQVERERSEPMSADSAEQAVEAEDDEVLALQDDALHHEIASIVNAIRRIDSGKFGNCTSCGETIQPARLAVMPTTSLCIDCARADTT
jgi:RNA polymerase-binding transcription factor DksA